MSDWPRIGITALAFVAVVLIAGRTFERVLWRVDCGLGVQQACAGIGLARQRYIDERAAK